MNYQYYIFAFYIFILIGIVLLLYRYLFSDLKQQRKLLEEKETKLLRLYQTIEEVMDEFYDSVQQSKTELLDTIGKAAETVKDAQIVSTAQTGAEVPAAGTGKAVQIYSKMALSDESAEPPFKELFSPVFEPAPDTRSMTRTEAILMLHNQGKNRSQIAKELNITLSEVDLVIGINKNGG